MANILIRFLVPSLLEVEISITLALVLIAILFLLENNNKKNSLPLNQSREIVPLDDKIQRNFSIEESQETSYVIKLEILAAKYLIGANLNGTSEPYAIIKCGEQKRFSSLVPSLRNPLWGEEFLFFVNSLPVQIYLTIYDWDTVGKCILLGTVVLPVAKAGQSGAIWHEFDTKSGQVCLQVSSFRLLNSNSLLTDLAGFKSMKNMLSENKNTTVAHHQPGPLQSIFRLPFDEVIIPFEDIHEIKRSQHSFVNPAISIILYAGANGLGAPPLCNRNGRVRYKFTSFWNRNQSFRALQDALTRYRAMLQAEKKVKMQSLTNIDQLTRVVKRNEEKGTNKKFFQPFINQDILVDSVDETFPCTAEQFFCMFLTDNSNFLMEHRYSRNGTELKINNWSPSEEHGGQIRKFTFKSPCNSPLCPPYTAVTELQHITLSADKGTLLYETVQQAHDVPFGSYFEIHCRWCLRTKSESSCQMVIKIGVHMKKWCILQSKIKSGATEEYKKEVNQILEEARAHLFKEDDSEKRFALGSENHETYQNR